MEISTYIVRGLVAALRDRGIAPEQLIREAGVDPEILSLSSRSVSIDVARACVRAAYQLSGDPALALRIGVNAPPQMLSVVGELLVHCPTMRSALAELERYIPLIFPGSRFHMFEEGERGHLVYEPPFADRFSTELTFALIMRIGSHFVSKQRAPIELRVRHARPDYVAVYDAIFRCPTRFGSEHDELVFERSLLDEKQPFNDETLLRLLKGRADVMLVEERRTEKLHERIRVMLRHESDLANVAPAQLARKLGMTPRRLRKRLSVEGHSLSALLDEVRRELAFDALVDPQMPIKQIADRVGFSEVSAFHRAFKRWTGITPARYRAQHALAHAS